MIFKKPSGVSWLIAFLGNPGTKYEYTRHNAGFIASDFFSEKYGTKITKSRFSALTDSVDIGGSKVLVMKPQTYMNLSGEAIKKAADYYKIPPRQIIVVSDETALSPGKIRVRPSGSAGGHNGLKNIIACLGTEDFPRIRIGVGAPPRSDYDMKDWVTGKPDAEDLKILKASAQRAADAAVSYILNGPQETMNKFN